MGNELPVIIDLWDEDNKIIFNNQFSKDFNKKDGIDLKEGTSIEELSHQHKLLNHTDRKRKIFTIDDIPYESSPLAKLDWKQTRNRMHDKTEWELWINDKIFYGTDKKLNNGGFLT